MCPGIFKASPSSARMALLVQPNVNFPPRTATADDRSVHISNGSVVYLPIRQPPTLSPMKIKVKKIHAVGVWSWVKSGGEDERCAVCQNPLDGCAPGSSFPGDDSPVVWGKCNHAFHLQCINRWLGTNNTCPICRREWEFQEANRQSNSNATSEQRTV